MATNSIGDLRRSSRLEKKPPWRSSAEVVEESVKIGEMSSVEDLLETGYFEGVPITCFSEELGSNISGVIKGNGFLCGCSQCNYKSEVLSAKMFEKYAGAKTKFQTDHIFFSNGINLYEVFQLIRNIPEDDFNVKILKLMMELKRKKFNEEPPEEPIMSQACKRKRKRERCNRIASMENNQKESLLNMLRLEGVMMTKQSKGVNNVEDCKEVTYVLDLLKTGLLEGACINYISETTQERLPGFIKGTGYVCGFSEYSYTGQVILSSEYQSHAGCTAFMPSNCIFLSNGDSILEVARKLNSVHGAALTYWLNQLVSKLEFRENDNRVKVIKTYVRNKRWFAASSQLKKPFEASRQLFKYYRRYNPERRLINVRGLLSTGLLEGFRVTYKRNEARLEAHIRGSSYECGCSSCNRTKAITAEELERHAREFSKNQNENIYLDCGMTLYEVVKELEGIPLCLLGNFLQEKIKCSPNYSSFETWKGSFKMDGGSPSLRSNFGNQLEVKSKSCSVQCSESRNAMSISEAMKTTGSTSDPVSCPGTVKDTNNTARSAVCKDDSNFVGDECHLGPASRKNRSPRLNKFRKNFHDFNVVPSALMHDIQKPVQRAMFDFSGSESTTTSDPDYNPLESTSEKGWTCGEITSLRRNLKKRGRRIFEEDGLPGENELTYQCRDKMVPSDIKTHAGMSQKRGRYRSTYCSDGKTPHESRSTYSSDGKTLHESSDPLADTPKSSSVPSSKPGSHGQNKHNKRMAKPLQYSTEDSAVSTRLRQKRVLQSQGVIVHCTICNGRYASLGDETDPNLIIFCDQCDRVYHVGCLKNEKSFKIQDVYSGTWFCCTDCTWVDNSLKKICDLGAKPVPPPFLDSLKRPHAAKNNPLNLSWQIFGGKKAEDQVLLSKSLKLIKGAFVSVLHGKDDIIQQMVFGNQVAGTGQDFRGMRCILIKINEEIVSIALVRVFGKFFAELPLVMSPKKWRRKGYFHMLLSLIEELLYLLEVRLLVAPVHEKMQKIWIQKLGFVKASDQKVKMLKEQHGLISFEDTAILVKDIKTASVTDPHWGQVYTRKHKATQSI